jgi:hypothetical protein
VFRSARPGAAANAGRGAAGFDRAGVTELPLCNAEGREGLWNSSKTALEQVGGAAVCADVPSQRSAICIVSIGDGLGISSAPERRTLEWVLYDERRWKATNQLLLWNLWHRDAGPSTAGFGGEPPTSGEKAHEWGTADKPFGSQSPRGCCPVLMW